MKKVTVMMALFAFVAGFAACGTSGGLGGTIEGKSFKSEGWMDKDTYRTIGQGVPKEGLRNKVQRRGTAREAAVLVAQSHVIEKFKGARVEGATGVSDYASTGFAASKEFAGMVKGGSVVKETYDDDDNCEVVYEIKSKGLQKSLTGAVVE